MKKVINKIISILNIITDSDNTIAQYIAGLGTIFSLILCSAALFVPYIRNNATSVYFVGIVCSLFIVYALTYIIRTYINNYKTKIQYHNEEVELLQNIFGEIHKHPLYENVNIQFTKKNKNTIKFILLDFIGEHEHYNTEYYEKLIWDCQHAVCLIDDLR